MPIYLTIRATLAHADAIASRPRAADVEEMWAAALTTTLDCMRMGLERSIEAWTWEADGVPICMLGITPIAPGTFLPWMVASSDLEKHSLQFMRQARPFLGRWRRQADLLVNWVDARNARAIRWLRAMGFQIFPPEPYGSLGLPFHRFEMRRR